MKKLIWILSLILISACRKEILEPYNPAGNINQPLQEKKLNYLNLVMTASNLTYEFETNVEFNSYESRIFLSVIDHEKGSVIINVLSDNNLIFVASIETEIPNLIGIIRGNVPKKIKVSCNDFSGKLRLQLSKVNL